MTIAAAISGKWG
ncbi:hypothetical protein YPPY04_0976, partial [Yersinia pestis PY-04]